MGTETANYGLFLESQWPFRQRSQPAALTEAYLRQAESRVLRGIGAQMSRTHGTNKWHGEKHVSKMG